MKKYKFIKIVIPGCTRYVKAQEGSALNWVMRMYHKKVSTIPGGKLDVLETLPLGCTTNIIINADRRGKLYSTSHPNWFSS